MYMKQFMRINDEPCVDACERKVERKVERRNPTHVRTAEIDRWHRIQLTIMVSIRRKASRVCAHPARIRNGSLTEHPWIALLLATLVRGYARSASANPNASAGGNRLHNVNAAWRVVAPHTEVNEQRILLAVVPR